MVKIHKKVSIIFFATLEQKEKTPFLMRRINPISFPDKLFD